jgi:hypothetical protein
MTDKKHALMSPSSANRWTHCPASVPLTKDLPNKSSKFAQEGTTAHEVAALCLEHGTFPAAYIGRLIDGVEVTEDMAHHLTMYVRFIRTLVSD